MEKVTEVFKNIAMGSLTNAFKDINPRRLSLQSDLRQSGLTYRKVLIESVEKIFKEKMGHKEGSTFSYQEVNGFDFNVGKSSVELKASLISPKTFEAQYVIEEPEVLAYLRKVLFITYWPVIISEITNKIAIDNTSNADAFAVLTSQLQDIVEERFPLVSVELPPEIYQLLIATFLRFKSYRPYFKGSVNKKFRDFLTSFLKGEVSKVGKGAKEGSHLFFHGLHYHFDDSLRMLNDRGLGTSGVCVYNYFGRVEHRPLARSTGLELIRMNAKNRYGHITGEDISMVFDSLCIEYSTRESQNVYKDIPNYLNFSDLKDEWHIGENKSKEFATTCMNITKSGFFVPPHSETLADETLRDQIKAEMYFPIIMYLMYKGFAFLSSWVRSYDYRDNCEFWTLPRVWTHIDGALPILVAENIENLYSFTLIARVIEADSVVLELTANEMINPEVVRRKANLAAESLALSLSIG